MSSEPGTLQRKLDSRLLNMIAIGGAIGTGIFLASGTAISLSGPGGTLLAYLVVGLMVYFLMTSLGEMAAFMPTAGSFYIYASRFVDPALGYALGWNYWYNWAITVASEIAAASIIMQYWFPNSPPIIWNTAFLLIIFALNALSVRGFGEVEYWFSFIKVSVIIIFIAAGIAILFGFTHYQAGGFKNWTMEGAPFHGGWLAMISAFMIAAYSFQGTELVGVAAGESKDPAESIPRAVKQIFWRILLFFVLSIFVISLLIPYTAPQLANSDVTTSPFTLVFHQYGIPYAAAIINAVILTAILSAGNSGLFAGTRMLWYLSKKGHVPHIFSRVNAQGIPMAALLGTTVVAMLTFLSSLIGGLIMTHSDDDGLVLPPKIAPAHVVILPIIHQEDDRADILKYCDQLAAELKQIDYHGRRVVVEIDTRDIAGGEKAWHWVKKGIPVRLEIGKKECAAQSVFMGRRDKAYKDKKTISKEELIKTLTIELDEMQTQLFSRAKSFMEKNTKVIDSKERFYEFFKGEGKGDGAGGFALAHWNGSAEVEAKLKQDLSVTIRCIPFVESVSDVGSVFSAESKQPGKCIFTDEPSKQRVVFAKAY